MATITDVLGCYTENDKIYEMLLDDVESERIVPFIGAGLSATYYPTWIKFLKQSIEGEGKSPEEKVNSMLSDRHFEEAASYVQERLGKIRFYDKMREAFSDKKLQNAELTITLQLICTLFHKSIITTNFDHVLKWAFEKMENPFVEIITPRRKLDMPAIDRIWRQHSLIKLHGSISKEEDIVFTKEDYDAVYGDSILMNSGTDFTKLLETVYTNNVLLFLGCSLEEDRTMKVLEQLLMNQNRDQYHYAFMELPEETQNKDNPYEPVVFKDGDKLSIMADMERRLSNRKIRVIWFPYKEYESIDLLLDGLCKHTKRKGIEKADLSISKYGIKTVSSFFINQAKTNSSEELQKIMRDFFHVDTSWKTMFSVICNKLDIPFVEVNDKLRELIKKKRKRILLTGHAGIGKSTIMLRSAVELARLGRAVYWINLAEVNNSQHDYENIIRYIHNSGVPKIPAILFIDNPYYGRYEIAKLRKAFSGGQKNIQVVMFDRIQRLYELTYENDDYLHNWFNSADIIIIHSNNNNNNIDQYEFLENNLVDISQSDDFSISLIPQNKDWIKRVITNFSQKGIRGFRSGDFNLVNRILEKEELYSCSIVEIQYHLLFAFAEISKKSYSKNVIDCLMDWDEWANRLVDWNIVNENDSLEYYQLLAVFGLFNIMTDIDYYVDFHNIPQKKRQLIQKLNMMIGEYNIEPIRFLSNTNQIAPKHDIICELFFSFNTRWKKPFQILFPYIWKMDVSKFIDFVNAVHLYIRNYNMHRKFNWIELVQALAKAPAYALIKHDNSMCVKIVQCMFWGYINEHDLNSAYFYLKEQLLDVLYKDNVFLLYDFASLCAELEFYDEALKALEHAVEINSFHIPSKFVLGKLYFHYKLDLSKSIEIFEDILSMKPRYSDARRYLAKVLDKQGLYGEAENQFNLALSYNPDDYRILVEYGNHYMLLNQDEKAIQKYNESLHVMPDNRSANISLGKIFMRKGSYDMAEMYLKRALQHRKMDLDILYYLSELYIKGHRPEDAIELYKSKERNWSDYTAYQAASGELFHRLGRYKEAIRKYQQALEISPTNSKALRGLTKIYINQKDFISAENLLKKTFQRFSDCPHVLKIYVEFFENTEQDGKIPKLLDSYINLTQKHDKQGSLGKKDIERLPVPEKREDMKKLPVPNNLEDILPLGALYRNLHMLDEAYGLLKTAYNKFENNADVLQELGEVCYIQEKYEEAVHIFEKLIKLHPEDQKVRARLAQIYIRNGNSEKAHQMLFDQLELNKSNKIVQIRMTDIKRDKRKEKRSSESHKGLVDSDDFINMYNLAHISEIIKEMSNDGDELIRFLNDAIYKNPKKFYLNNILIEHYGNLRMYYEARGLYKKTLKIHKNPISTYLVYEQVCVKDDRIPEAITVCKEALNHYPDQLNMYSELARLLALDNKTEEAMKILEKVVAPKYTHEIYSQLLKFYYDYGEKQKMYDLVYQIMDRYKYNCQELVSALQFFSANKIEIQNNYIENVIRNYALTDNQKRKILKIFEHLYEKYKVKTLYEKIVKIDVDKRKKINGLYAHYKKITSLESEEAIWKYALELSPEDSLIIQSLINLYIDQGGLDCALNFMEQYYNRHIKLASVAIHYYGLLKKCGMTEKKQMVLEQALSINPDSQTLLSTYAKCCRDVGNKEGMIATLRKLLKINPNNLEYVCRLADAYLCTNDPQSAKQVYVNYLENESSGRVSYANINLAEIYIQEEAFELAFQQLFLLVDQKYRHEKAKKLNYSQAIKWGMENMDDISIKRFLEWLNKNQCFDAVSAIYEMKIKRDKLNISDYYFLGALYDDLCQFEKAAWYLDEGLKYTDEKKISANYYHKAASVWRKLCSYDKALGFYQKELAIKESFYGYSGLGLLHIWIGKLNEAEKYLVKAVKILVHKPSPSVYLNFGILKFYQNKYEEAEKFLMLSSKFLSRNGKKPIKAYYWLARLYSKLGNEKKTFNYLGMLSKKEMAFIEDIDKEIFLGQYPHIKE